MFRILRYYSIASFVSIVIAAVAMLVIYRAIAIAGIERLAESSSLAIARTALNPIRADLTDFLTRVARLSPGQAAEPLPEPLHAAISELMHDAYVRRVKIYNTLGVVAFSTKHEQIGTHYDNPAFAAAMGGKVSVKLVYRDTFNPFDGETEDDNLVQSYIPVRRRASEPVIGVFELYTDVNPLVQQAERFELFALTATVIILATLYVVLLLVVRRARDIIDDQAQTIREKNAMLEALSRESLRREERERKKLATDLHEGLAQTLSAVKVAVEASRAGRDEAQGDSLAGVVPDLQRAIDKVRSIAVDLRPPSLDDMGLFATLDTLCRQFGDDYPSIRIERAFGVAEAHIPMGLKVVIYRIVESFLRVVGERRAASAVDIDIGMDEGAIALVIEADSSAVVSALEAGEGSRDPALMEIRERAIISGGRLSIDRDEHGVTTLRAAWPVASHAGGDGWAE